MSHPGLARNTQTDLLNIRQITVARDCYLHNVRISLVEPSAPQAVETLHELLSEASFHRLQVAHPLYSPGLAVDYLANGAARPSSRSIDEIVNRLRANGTRFFVQHGSAEVFADETEAFLEAVAPVVAPSSLKPNGVVEQRPESPLNVVSLVERGGWHCNATMFPPWNGRSLIGRLLGIGAAEARACSAFGVWLGADQDEALIVNDNASHCCS